MHWVAGDVSVRHGESAAEAIDRAAATLDRARSRRGALRLLVDGSFVTAKPEPEDIDAVMLVPASFSEQVERGVQAAMELEEMFLTRQPEELFPAENEAVWQGWCEFFSRTREPDRRRKGLVEIVL